VSSCDLSFNSYSSQAVLNFLSAADVGRLESVLAEEDAQGEASECELRERNGREEERRQEAGDLGAEVEERPLPSHALRHGLRGGEVGSLGEASRVIPL